MIQNTIHYCWFGGAPYNDLILKCMDSWREMLPEYHLKLWNEANSPLDHPFVRKMYRGKKWAFVADYVRLHALYKEGGIYLDTDMEILKSLNAFSGDKCFLGFESPEFVAAGIIGSEKKHPFIKQCLDAYDHLQEPVNIPSILTHILTRSGLNSYKNQVVGEVSLYESEVFYPWKFRTEFDEKSITEKSYAVHHWHYSWKPNLTDKLKRKIKSFGNRKNDSWKSAV